MTAAVIPYDGGGAICRRRWSYYMTAAVLIIKPAAVIQYDGGGDTIFVWGVM